jgi:hypothetical protein
MKHLLRLAPLFLLLLLGCPRTEDRPRDTEPPHDLSTPVPEATVRPMVEPPPQATEAPRGHATIYVPVMDENGTRLEPKTVTFTGTAATPEATAQAAITAMARLKDSPLPSGTRARSVAFDGGTAVVDLSPEFKAHFSGGEQAEALAINALLATLGQFPGVKQVQILVAGAKIPSLGGGQSLDQPLTVPQR